MRKIFLFGAGLSGVNPRSTDARSARPGLLQIGDSLDSAVWTESTPPRCPEREYFAHSGGKNDNMPPRNPKRDTRAKSQHATNPSARRTPDTQTLRGRPPTRVEPNCDALDKLSELRVSVRHYPSGVVRRAPVGGRPPDC